jgi:hypothetical protein
LTCPGQPPQDHPRLAVPDPLRRGRRGGRGCCLPARG